MKYTLQHKQFVLDFAKNVMKFLKGLLRTISDMADFLLKFEILTTTLRY